MHNTEKVKKSFWKSSTFSYLLTFISVIFIIILSIGLSFIIFYGTENDTSEVERYSFIAQIDGGGKRCMTYMLPVNRRSVYISSNYGSYSMKYSVPGRWYSGHSYRIKNGVTDFTPVDSCD